MKFKKVSMLFIGGLLVTALSGCSLQEIKAWVKQNVVQPARSVLDPVLNPGQQEEPKKDDQKPDDQKPDQGGDQGGEGEHGGEGEGGGEQTKNSYTITFQNYDETVLQSGKVEEGELPVYAGEEPTREGDAQYSYSFDGWDKEIVAATADATYTATFTQSVNEYTVKFLNYDDSELQSEKLAYGAMPEYKGNEPTKPETDAATFVFAGWDHEIVAVTGNATYKATFNSVAKEYTVKFMNGEQVLQEGKVAYGETPAYTGAEPTKESTAQYTYAFSGWDPALAPVTGNATYQAQFSETLRQYQVTFDTKGGSDIDPVMVNYGEHVSAPTAPTKDADAEHIYFFDGWELNGVDFDFENAVIEGPITLEAKWDAVSATEHGKRCEYTHYAELAADYEKSGYKEFWFCSLHNNHVMSEPSEGNIVEATAPYAGEIAENDSRYISKLDDANHYAELDISGWQDPALLYSKVQYTDVTSVTFKLRVNGNPSDFDGKWAAIAISGTNTDWETDPKLEYTVDGEWRLITLNFDARTGYIKFCYNMDYNFEGSFDIDDFSIKHAGGVAFEDFEDADCLFTLDSSHARVRGVKGMDKFASLDNGTNHGGTAIIHTIDEFTNVTNISFDMRFPEGKKKSWLGFGVASDHSIYSGMSVGGNLQTSYENDGKWHHFSRNISSTSGYINFFDASGEFAEGNRIDLDNIVITYDNGKQVTESFDGQYIFTASTSTNNKGRAYVGFRDYSPNPLGVVAVDAQISSVETRKGYLSTFDQSKGVDKEYGAYIKLDHWKLKDDQARSWIGLTKTTELSAVETALGGEPTNYFFYMYNPLSESQHMELFIQKSAGLKTRIYVEMPAQAWSKFEFKPGVLDSNDTPLAEPHEIGLDIYPAGSNGKLLGNGWKITSIYAERVIPDPSEFGTVAYNLKEGTIVQKIYSPTFDLKKGSDDTYGPYIQLDNWKCKDNQNRCWIGFSDGAVSLADIQTELGGNVGAYYFFVFNPLNEDFGIKLMIGSEYAEAKSVTLTANSWNKVTMKTGEYSNGQTLTEASQIGIDHFFSEDGASMGSGWKISCVFAEKEQTVNPAPFGTVAWDAQTGDLRDIKGYASSYDLSHGIDNTYGAYIQLDNWKCNSAKEQCWVTLSDTAVSVADLETALSGSITNYFFYIYNPLAEDFSFKIMLKSSSGMNPNKTVNCVAGAWTKVTIAYNQADNGSYPALTSASQIGITHVFSSNGQDVGSGFRITSVYAE